MPDPFAAYGGQAHSAPPPDPFAAYGGSAHEQQPATPPAKPGFFQRMGLVPDSNNNGAGVGEKEIQGGLGDAVISGMGDISKRMGAAYVKRGPAEVVRGAGDVIDGKIAQGGSRIIGGAGVTLAPLAPESIASNPIMAARGLIGGFGGGQLAGGITQLSGGNPDQVKFAGDIGNLAGGFAAATGLPRALLQTPLKEAILKNPDLMHTVLEPRKAFIKWLGSQIEDRLGVMGGSPAAAEAAPASAPPPAFNNQPAGGSPMFNNRTPGTLGFRGNENAPTIGAGQPQINVYPDPNARPSIVTRPANPSTFVPTPQNIPTVNPPKSTAFPMFPETAPLDRQLPAAPNPQPPAYLAMKAQGPRGTNLEMPVISPNAEPPALKASVPATPKTRGQQMLDDLRQWDMIRKLHDEMDRQIGMGQDEAQAWMDAHNQQAPGAKKIPAAVQAAAEKAQAPIPQGLEPQVPQNDGDIESLLLKSLQMVKAKRAGN
jgi:hypothetical protein